MFMRFPTDWVGITRGYGYIYNYGFHGGVDLGWSSAHGGPNVPLKAPLPGTVVTLVDKYADGYNYAAGYGNHVILRHSYQGKTIYTLMAHMLRGSFRVAVGQTVTQGQVLGQMGNSGNSKGCHCHFEVRVGANTSAAREDPCKWAYVLQGMEVHPDDAKLVLFPPAVCTEPEDRNRDADQVNVTIADLRVRKTPSLKGEILGYCAEGYYTIRDTVDADGYAWHQIGPDKWIAQVDGVEYLRRDLFRYTATDLPRDKANALIRFSRDIGIAYKMTEV